MLNLNLLLRGDLDDVDTMIDEHDLSNSEMRAVMQNLIVHIQNLKKKKRIGDLEYKTSEGDDW